MSLYSILSNFEAHWFSWTTGLILGGLWLLRLAGAAWGMRRIADISKPEWDVQTPQPRVSIIVPALNEEETVEPALTSLLKLDYANYGVIAVDDRSTDRTCEIMDRLAATSNGTLPVIHIAQLPRGWLCKPHATSTAAQQARGNLPRFTSSAV